LVIPSPSESIASTAVIQAVMFAPDADRTDWP
jgi:hypothetical protein